MNYWCLYVLFIWKNVYLMYVYVMYVLTQFSIHFYLLPVVRFSSLKLDQTRDT